MSLTVTLTSDQASLILGLLGDKVATLHNHIASAVENPNGQLARSFPPSVLVADLRSYQAIAAEIRGVRNAAEAK
jgi:hypothetical protein